MVPCTLLFNENENMSLFAFIIFCTFLLCNTSMIFIIHVSRWFFCDTSCTDVDECETGVAQCEHYCHNSPGSFTCSCRPGYKKNPADDTKCNGI